MLAIFQCTHYSLHYNLVLMTALNPPYQWGSLSNCTKIRGLKPALKLASAVLLRHAAGVFLEWYRFYKDKCAFPISIPVGSTPQIWVRNFRSLYICLHCHGAGNTSLIWDTVRKRSKNKNLFHYTPQSVHVLQLFVISQRLQGFFFFCF